MKPANPMERKTWCPDARRYDRGDCGWPSCGCPDETLTAYDLRLRIKILCNTITSGEAAEDECYRQIGKLVSRLESLIRYGKHRDT